MSVNLKSLYLKELLKKLKMNSLISRQLTLKIRLESKDHLNSIKEKVATNAIIPATKVVLGFMKFYQCLRKLKS